MRFPPSFLDDIRDRLNISEVIGSRVQFDRKKTNAAKGDYWACCPFHGEKTPSFHCEDRKGRYHCFGCGVSGDHFRFLTELDGLAFPEAVERLADQAGLSMPVLDKFEQARMEKRASLYDVMQMAAEFFRNQLQTSIGANARAYLRDRGLSANVQSTFGLGYAPNNRNSLKEYLSSKGVEKTQIEACGLVVFGEGIAVSYDRFRDRIMYPIEDSKGKIIAFGGRALSENAKAKYLNSPETELFHKSNVLYNFSRARQEIYRREEVIVVEGYMDVIALYAAGFTNAVAPLGTALTESQLGSLWKLTDTPTLCFDGDPAGRRAAGRVVGLSLPKLEAGKSLKFCLLPDGQDPDDILRLEGTLKFKELLNMTVPLSEMLLLRRIEGAVTETPEQKAKIESQIMADVSLIKDVAVFKYYKSHMRLRLYELFGVRKQANKRNANIADLSKLKVSDERLARLLLGFCVEFPGLLEGNLERFTSVEFTSPAYQLFARELHKLYIEYDGLNVSDIYTKLSPEFAFLLESIHGEEKSWSTSIRNGAEIQQHFQSRGYRLRELFPALKLEPGLETIEDTFLFLLEQLELSQIARELEDEKYSPNCDVERVLGLQQAFSEKQNAVFLFESELDEQFQSLRKLERLRTPVGVLAA